MPNDSTALEVTPREADALSSYPSGSPQNAWRLAEGLAASGIVPRELRDNPAAVFSIMARGALVGLHWSVAVQTLYVVHGRVGLPAEVMAGLCDADADFEYFECREATNDYAVVEAKKHRWTEPRQHRVTVEDAIKAGYLDGKHSALWGVVGADGKPDETRGHRRATMLRHMAEREAARMWNPRRFAGLADRDEMAGGGAPVITAGSTMPNLDGAALAAKGADSGNGGAVDPTPNGPEPQASGEPQAMYEIAEDDETPPGLRLAEHAAELGLNDKEIARLVRKNFQCELKQLPAALEAEAWGVLTNAAK